MNPIYVMEFETRDGVRRTLMVADQPDWKGALGVLYGPPDNSSGAKLMKAYECRPELIFDRKSD